MTILATLNHTPEWAVTPGTPPLSGAPADPQKYADFWGDMAARYAGRISAYEGVCETNPTGASSGLRSRMPRSTRRSLKPAYLAIKAADPNATVVAGSVGYTQNVPGETIDAVEFISDMYANGAAGYFDALAFPIPTSHSGIRSRFPTRTGRPAAESQPDSPADGRQRRWRKADLGHRVRPADELRGRRRPAGPVPRRLPCARGVTSTTPDRPTSSRRATVTYTVSAGELVRPLQRLTWVTEGCSRRRGRGHRRERRLRRAGDL